MNDSTCQGAYRRAERHAELETVSCIVPPTTEVTIGGTIVDVRVAAPWNAVGSRAVGDRARLLSLIEHPCIAEKSDQVLLKVICVEAEPGQGTCRRHAI